MEIGPNSAIGQVYKRELLRLMKQESEALNLLQKLVELYPDNYKAEYFLGSVLEDEKKRKEAMESYKMIIGRK